MLTLADIPRFNPDTLAAIAGTLRRRAADGEQVRAAVDSIMGALPWQGAAHDAATASAGHLSAGLAAHVEFTEATARAVSSAEEQFRGIQADWRKIQRMADRWGVTIDEATAELAYLPAGTEELRAEQQRRAEILRGEIEALLARASAADQDLAAAVEVASGQAGPEAVDRALSDHPMLTDAQGNADAQDLYDGTIDAQTAQRLDEATTLTPEQLAALDRGELVLPAGQLAYLTSLAKGLDGLSSTELRRVAAAAGGRHLVDALRLATNPHVSSQGPDGATVRGGLDNAPRALRQVLTEPSLRVGEDVWKRLVSSGDRGFDPRVLFTDWPALQDAAAILGHGDDALMRGSALDHALLDKSQDALKWMNTGIWSTEANSFANSMTYDVQRMLSASGRDPLAAHDLVVLPDDAAGNRVYNDEFLHHALTHHWTDEGTALSTLLADVPDVAAATDPAQLAAAHRAGETTNAFTQYVAHHPDELLNIADADDKSLGELSPAFTRTLAEATIPYIDDMMNNPAGANTPGFQPLDHIIENPRIENTRNLFGVLNTDPFAAQQLNAAAYATLDHYQQSFAESVVRGDPQYFDLKSSGALRGVIDLGANIAANDAIADQNAAAAQAFANKQTWFDAAQKLPVVSEFLGTAGKIPGVREVIDQIVVGNAPVPIDPTQAPLVSTELIKYSIASRLLAMNVGDTGLLGDAINPDTGRLTAPTAPGADIGAITDAVERYLASFGLNMNTALDGYRDYYRDSLDNP